MSGLCSPWLTFDDLSADDQARADEAVWSVWLRVASTLLYELSGEVWNGGGCAAEQTWGVELCRCPPVGRGHRCTDPYSRLKLSSPTVTAVLSVTVAGVVLDPAGYRLDGDWLTRVGDRWPLYQSVITARFAWGFPPDSAGREAVREYARELVKAHTGDGKCDLPKRTISVARQGVTIAMTDPAKYLDQGRTGYPPADLWIAAVNPVRQRQPAALWTPETAVGGRTVPISAP